jgi:hypothetical protein
MKPTCWTIVMSAVLGAGPAAVWAAPPSSTVAAPGGGSYAAATVTPEAGCSEGRYPYDAADPWTHGYFQEIPAYGGFHVFRPYNYKHVLIQSQLAADWGLSPTAPYSQQFWRAYRVPASR